MTKARLLLLFTVPRTSVMPSRATELAGQGIQFRWTTNDANILGHLHDLIVQTLREVSLTELRSIAHMGRQLVLLGSPFIPEDAPLPDSLKEISTYIKSVI